METALAGVLLLVPDPQPDERGWFARTWDAAPLRERGLTHRLEQVSTAFNEISGTLRGLHFQETPHAEAKSIRCTGGAIYDVAVDLRDTSATKHRWVGLELSAANRHSLYIPEGCAHGYVTLAHNCEVEYLISSPYAPAAARGYRWDDPAFRINWPVSVQRISARDAAWPWFGRDSEAAPTGET